MSFQYITAYTFGSSDSNDTVRVGVLSYGVVARGNLLSSAKGNISARVRGNLLSSAKGNISARVRRNLSASKCQMEFINSKCLGNLVLKGIPHV